MAYRALATLSAVVCFLSSSGRVTAQCTSRSDANVVLRTAKQAVSCNDRRLRRGPGEQCILTPPPVCAGTLVSDAVALAYGANDYYGGENPAPVGVDSGAMRDQLRCQRMIGKAIAIFVGKEIEFLVRGLTPADATAKARRLLDKLPDNCAVPVAQDASSIILPD